MSLKTVPHAVWMVAWVTVLVGCPAPPLPAGDGGVPPSMAPGRWLDDAEASGPSPGSDASAPGDGPRPDEPAVTVDCDSPGGSGVWPGEPLWVSESFADDVRAPALAIVGDAVVLGWLEARQALHWITFGADGVPSRPSTMFESGDPSSCCSVHFEALGGALVTLVQEYLSVFDLGGAQLWSTRLRGDDPSIAVGTDEMAAAWLPSWADSEDIWPISVERFTVEGERTPILEAGETRVNLRRYVQLAYRGPTLWLGWTTADITLRFSAVDAIEGPGAPGEIGTDIVGLLNDMHATEAGVVALYGVHNGDEAARGLYSVLIDDGRVSAPRLVLANGQDGGLVTACGGLFLVSQWQPRRPPVYTGLVVRRLDARGRPVGPLVAVERNRFAGFAHGVDLGGALGLTWHGDAPAGADLSRQAWWTRVPCACLDGP